MRLFFKKKSQVPVEKLIGLILLVVIIVTILLILPNIIKFFSSSWSSNTCRTTVVANSYVRGGTLASVLSSRERVAIHCPRDEDYEITYNSVRGRTSTSTVIGYNTMDEIARRMVQCDYRYAGDLEIAPFENNNGIFCGLCGKVSFDDRIQRTDFGYVEEGVKKLGVIPDFYSFLLNTKDRKTKQYYSEILFGYKKDVVNDVEFGREFGLGSLTESNVDLGPQRSRITQIFNDLDDSNKFDIGIDTKREYYISHVVFKGSNIRTLGGLMDEFSKDSAAKTALCGIASVALVAAVVPSGGLSLVGLGVGAGALATCYSGSSIKLFNLKLERQQVPVFRVTTLIPADELEDFRCTAVYGLEKKS